MRRLAVIEWDGVLAERFVREREAMARAFAWIGKPVHDRKQLQGLAAAPLHTVLLELGKQLSPEDVWSWRRAFAETLGELKQGGAAENFRGGAARMIDDLRAKGWILAIATANSRRATMACLEQNGLLEAFSVIACADDDLPHGKPNPELLRGIMREALTFPAATAMISDKKADMIMARGAGAHAIGVSWGESAVGDLCMAGGQEVAADFSSLRLLLETLRWRPAQRAAV